MAARGHETALLTSDDTHAPSEWRGKEGLPSVERIDAPAQRGGFLSARQRRDLETRLSACDVIDLHGMWIPSAAQVAGCCWRVGVPYVVTLHGMLDDWSTRQKPWRKRVYLAVQGNAYLRGAANVHVTSEAELEQVAR